MPKLPPNHGKPWTRAADQKLAQLAAGNTPTRVTGLLMGRTEDAIYTHASDLGISLKPTNQAPYNRKPK